MTAFNFAQRVDENTIYLMVGLLLAIFVPTSIFFSYQLFKKKSNVTIAKRYPVITFGIAICFSLRLIISAINLLMITLDKYRIGDGQYKLLLLFDNIFLYLFLILLMWRMWNILCDLKWINKSLLDNQWRAIISIEDDTVIGYGNGVSFWLKINGTCGKSSFCGKIFVPLFFILFFCLVNIPLLIFSNFTEESDISVLISRISFIICMLLLIIIYIITPKKIAGNRDGFFIVNELTILFIFYLFIFLIAIAGFIYGRFIYSISDDQRRYIYLLIEESLYFAFEWLIVMFSTFYVLGKTGEMFGKYHLSRNRGRTDVKMIKMDKNVNTQLYQALQTKDVFDTFLRYLAADFNVKYNIYIYRG